ncbi:transporter [Luteolibacter algae]|uniref:Transporter n=1 Tax=Luteolibacter algae TaxID=454151 RepID=A0ABW5D7I8_9BACT
MSTVLMTTGVAVGFPKDETPLRPLSTDRPDATESPYTVDKGHFQFELEVLSYSMDGEEDSFALSELNFKYGITGNSDLQLVLPLYEHVVDGANGFGDIQLRFKQNLWGNDSGRTAFAIMPFIQLPTGADGITTEKFEGGVILPLGISTAGRWSYGVQVELDLVGNELESGHHFSFLSSATAACELNETMGMFLELVGIANEGGAVNTEAYFNTGLTHAVSETVQLDGGVRIGLTSDSTDFTPFAGVSVKF